MPATCRAGTMVVESKAVTLKRVAARPADRAEIAGRGSPCRACPDQRPGAGGVPRRAEGRCTKLGQGWLRNPTIVGRPPSRGPTATPAQRWMEKRIDMIEKSQWKA